MADEAKTPEDEKPGWWIYRGTGDYNKHNRLSSKVIAGLKQADTPPWRRFDPEAARQRGARFIPEPYEIERVNAAPVAAPAAARHRQARHRQDLADLCRGSRVGSGAGAALVHY